MVTKSPSLLQTTFATPFGPLRLLASGPSILALGWDPPWEGVGRTKDGLSFLTERILAILQGKGKPTQLRLEPHGTPFQKRVWKHLMTIPRGACESYGEVATAIGCPRGSRAVAQACGANPIVILIPCHRVIAARGRLGGYGPGPEKKIALLRSEGLKIMR